MHEWKDQKTIDKEATSLLLGRLMEGHELTVSDVKLLLDLKSEQAVYRWLNAEDKTLPSLQHFVELSDALEIPLDDMIVREPKNQDQSEQKDNT